MNDRFTKARKQRIERNRERIANVVRREGQALRKFLNTLAPEREKQAREKPGPA